MRKGFGLLIICLMLSNCAPSEKSIRIGLQKHIKGWMQENNIQSRFEECIDRTKLTNTLTGTDDGKYFCIVGTFSIIQ